MAGKNTTSLAFHHTLWVPDSSRESGAQGTVPTSLALTSLAPTILRLISGVSMIDSKTQDYTVTNGFFALFPPSLIFSLRNYAFSNKQFVRSDVTTHMDAEAARLNQK